MSDPIVDGERDFFISHATADRAWAEWIAVTLERSGYTTYSQSFDFRPGTDFAHMMQKAASNARCTIAVLSPAYLTSQYGEAEWRSAFAKDPSGELGLLIPVRVLDCEAPGILDTRVYVDLVGLAEDGARKRLLAGVDRDRPRPTSAPFPGKNPASVPFPGAPADRQAGATPNLPARNPGFVGREQSLQRLATALETSDRAVIQSRNQMAGVGKTQLAIEYAYRYADRYELIWLVPAENVDLIGGQLTQLAITAGVARPDVTGPVAAHAVAEALREGRRWLLIFDNADNPPQLAAMLPRRGGHVVITSRNRGWDEIAAPVEIGLFDRAESVQLLQGRVAGLSAADTERIADALGDLPLALAQAAAMLRKGLPTGEFLALLHDHAATVLGHSGSDSYPTPLAETVRLSAARLAADSPEAAQLLDLCALLGPEPIPPWLFTQTSVLLPPPLRDLVADRLAFYDTVEKLSTSGLAGTGADGILLHRLVQAILRDGMDADANATTRSLIADLVAAAAPEDTDNPELWPQWAVVAPHVVALDPANTSVPALREAACRMVLHMLRRGDYDPAASVVEQLVENWRDRLGLDATHTLKAATQYSHALRMQGHYHRAHTVAVDTVERYQRTTNGDSHDSIIASDHLGGALQALGDYVQARLIRTDVLVRTRTVLGPDHPDTLTASASLAITIHALGEYAQAQAIEEEVLARRRVILGPDHPETVTSAINLATTLYALGNHVQARAIYEEALARRRAVLGPDHPKTIGAAASLAVTVHALGDYTLARSIEEDVLAKRRAILGPDHPDTLTTAANLATTLFALGDYTQARTIEEDVFAKRRAILGPDHPDTLTAAANLATTLNNLGQAKEAAGLAKDAYERAERILGRDHPSTLRHAGAYARILMSRGQLFPARKLTKETLQRQRRLLGRDHPDTRRTQDLQAALSRLMGGPGRR